MLCFAALVCQSGHAEAGGSKCGTPAVMADMEAWVISGAAFGLLAKNQAVGVFIGVIAAIGSLAAFIMFR